MSMQYLRRVHVLRQAMEQKLQQREAAVLLGLTGRQVRRLIQRVRPEGERGVAHRGRGRPSNRRIPEQVRATVLTLYETRYGDCAA